MKLFKYIFTLIVIVTASNVTAQVYPVQVTVATTPPYYNYLSHYGDQNNHLLVVATLTDFNSPPVNVRLRLKIEGAGYTLRTREDIPIGNVYTLSPGVPVFIQGDELSPLLSEQNLAVVSGSPNLNNLTEGITSICVEVVENGSGAAILSTSNCTSFLLQLMQPPQPFLPFCNSVVDTASMFQTFQWSQPQNYIPSIGSELNYTFSLYEWIDTNNYNIFQTGQGLVYTTQTTSPIVQVSNYDVAFQNGRKYIWRVQAQLSSYGLPIQMITQNGLSQPCSFYYGKPVTIQEALADGLTINLTTEALTTRKGQALWTVTDETPGQGLSTYSSYIVEYRKKASEGSSIIYPWSIDTVVTLQLPIYQLEPEQTYEVRVSGMSGTYTSEQTPISEFTTPSARDYACGEADLPYMPSNYQPLSNLHMGDVVQIGQFSLNVTQATPLGIPGRYSGYGEIPHDFIGGAKVKVRFDNLLIDREFVVREGIANAMTDGAEGWMNDYYLDHAFRDTVGFVTAYGYSGDSTSIFVVVDGDTLSYTFDLPYPIVIYGEGNIAYQFWPDGTVVITTWGTTPSTDQLDATKNLFARFEAVEGAEQLFDKKQFDHFAPNYEVIQCVDNFNYWVPNTAKGTTGTTQVKAIVHVNTVGYNSSNMHFEVKGGYTVVPHSQLNDTTFILTLPAKQYDYQVYAKYEESKIGKLNIVSYDSVIKKVRIVPLVSAGNLSATTISQGLSTQFKASKLGFEVIVDSLFSSSEFNSSATFNDPDANLMSKYTDQMRELRTVYASSHQLQNDEYLVFVIPGFENPDIDGYMVRGKALGFVTAGALSTNFISTLAHELGHGIGGLQHAWGSDQSKQGLTTNLMDYSGSSTKTLTRLQWDAMHDAPFSFSLFDDEEDAESMYVSISKLEPFKNANGTYTFLDNTKKAVTLPSDTKWIRLSTLDRMFQINTDIEQNSLTPVGALVSFKLGNDSLYLNTSSGFYRSVNGQTQLDDASKYIDNLTEISNPVGAITGMFSLSEELVTESFFMVDIVPNSTIKNWIIFDENEVSKDDISVVEFINHYRIASKPIVNQHLESSANIGANIQFSETQIGIDISGDVEGAFQITPYNVFRLTPNFISVNYYLKYLLLVNQKKSDFQYFSDCLNSIVNTQVGKEHLDNMLRNSDPYNPPFQMRDELGNFISQKQQIESYFKKSIDEAMKVQKEASYNGLKTGILNNNLEQIKNWLKDQDGCVITAMPSGIRKSAFMVLIQDDHYWAQAKWLIEMLPQYNKPEVEKFFNLLIEDSGNGSSWIDYVLPQLDSYNGDATDLDILNKIAAGIAGVINDNLDHPALQPSTYTKVIFNPLDPFNSDPASVKFSPLSQPVYFVKSAKSKDYYAGETGSVNVHFLANNDLGTITWANGKVHVTQSYLIGPGGTNISNQGTELATSQSIDYYLNPYELVKVVFLDNYADQLGFDEGTQHIIPAFQLLLYKQGIENDEYYDTWNTVINATTTAIAVLSAPFTLGGSLYVVGATSLGIMNENIHAARNNATNAELPLYNDWDKFYTIAGMAEGAIGVARIIPNLPEFIVSTKKFFTRLKNLPNNASELWKGIKSIFSGGTSSGNGGLASNPDFQPSLNTIVELKNQSKLTKQIGSASDLELASIQRYTVNGDIILSSMRNGNETVIDAVTFSSYQSQLYQSMVSGLIKLRLTNRLVTTTVVRGRTYSLTDFNTLFNSGNVNVPLKGMVSCTKNEAVAIDFLSKSGANIQGAKVKVIMRIKSKNGVDIDDISDWGANLVNERHPGNLIQEEVLLEEGYFNMTGSPQPYLENGVPKIEIVNGVQVPWYIINLEETGNTIRTIN